MIKARPLERLLASALLLCAFSAAASLAQPAAEAASEPAPIPGGADLAFPTNIAIAPDGRIFFNEKDGRIRIIENGKLLAEPFAALPVVDDSETGLLGLALDPNFPSQPWIYVYFSDSGSQANRIVRFRADGNNASGPPQDVFTLLPVENGYHNGGDIAFGPDGKLYVTVGEIHQATRAQDVNDLGGKILRLNPDGSIPSDNPFGPDNPVYSLGHRNSFGICFDPATGDLWETENGPESDDEVNRIVAGKNYGWPDQLGPGGEPKFVDPVFDFPTEIVPTGCTFSGGVLYFGSYHGDLRRSLDPYGSNPPQSIIASFPSGITDVEAEPTGGLLVATDSAIYRLPDSAPQASSAGPEPGGGKHPTDNGAPAAKVWGVVILLVCIVGGLVFRRLQKKDAANAASKKEPAKPSDV